MFLRLGMQNSLRQAGRSLLILAAMALSAISLTSAFSLSQGEMKGSHQFYRQLLGGDILVTPVKWSGQRVQDVTGDGRVHYQRLTPTGLSWLERYYPELYQEGYFADSAAPPRLSFTAAELSRLAEQPGISAVTVQPQLTADLTNLTQDTGRYASFVILPLPDSGTWLIRDDEHPEREVPIDLNAYQSGDQSIGLINSWFFLSDQQLDAAAAAVPDEALMGYDRSEVGTLTPEQFQKLKRWYARWQLVREMQLPHAGETARLILPRLRLAENGEHESDYTQLVQFDLQVGETVQVPIRSLTWSMGLYMETETAHLHGAYLWVSAAAWRELWRQVAGDEPPPLQNVALQVEDRSQLGQTVQRLQSEFPQYTFIDVESFSERMESLPRIDQFYRAPSYLYTPAKQAGLAMPARLGGLLGVACFLISGMLLASRMLTGAASRRQEIGILKALGARRRDIILMTMAESLLLALSGADLGFLCARAGAMAIELSNQTPWLKLLQNTAREGGLVIGLAGLTAVLFSLLPALKLSGFTVMGVLRGE